MSKGRLKVGDSTYSLELVTSVTPQMTTKHHRQEKRLWRRLVWFVLFGSVVLPFTGGLTVVAAIGAGIMAVREYLRDERNRWDQKNHYHDAEITLNGAGTPIKILIGRFPTRAPLTTWELLGGPQDEPLPEATIVFFKNVERVKTISDAVGRAIGQRVVIMNPDVAQAQLSTPPVGSVVTIDRSVALPVTDFFVNDTPTEEALKSVTISIEDSSITINGSLIPIPTSINPLDQLLGSHRCRQPHQFFWDNCGIGAWGEDQNSITAFTIYLRENEYWGREYYPKRIFSGALSVGGVSVTLETKIGDIITHKSGLPLTKTFLDSWVNVPFNNFLGDCLHLEWRMTISVYPTNEGTISSILFTQPKGVKRRMVGWLKETIHQMIYG